MGARAGVLFRPGTHARSGADHHQGQQHHRGVPAEHRRGHRRDHEHQREQPPRASRLRPESSASAAQNRSSSSHSWASTSTAARNPITGASRADSAPACWNEITPVATTRPARGDRRFRLRPDRPAALPASLTRLCRVLGAVGLLLDVTDRVQAMPGSTCSSGPAARSGPRSTSTARPRNWPPWPCPSSPTASPSTCATRYCGARSAAPWLSPPAASPGPDVAALREVAV